MVPPVRCFYAVPSFTVPAFRVPGCGYAVPSFTIPSFLVPVPAAAIAPCPPQRAPPQPPPQPPQPPRDWPTRRGPGCAVTTLQRQGVLSSGQSSRRQDGRVPAGPSRTLPARGRGDDQADRRCHASLELQEEIAAVEQKIAGSKQVMQSLLDSGRKRKAKEVQGAKGRLYKTRKMLKRRVTQAEASLAASGVHRFSAATEGVDGGNARTPQPIPKRTHATDRVRGGHAAKSDGAICELKRKILCVEEKIRISEAKLVDHQRKDEKDLALKTEKLLMAQRGTLRYFRANAGLETAAAATSDDGASRRCASPERGPRFFS